MARLQRKKPVNSRKKKKPAVNEPVSSPMKSGLGKGTAAVSPDKKKRSLIAGGKIPQPGGKSLKSTSGKKRKNYLDMAMQFLREVIMELKKVTWPSRKQTIGSTLVMIILVMIISLFLGMVDMGLSSLIHAVFQ